MLNFAWVTWPCEIASVLRDQMNVGVTPKVTRMSSYVTEIAIHPEHKNLLKRAGTTNRKE